MFQSTEEEEATKEQRRFIPAVGVMRWSSVLQQHLHILHPIGLYRQSQGRVSVQCLLLQGEVSRRQYCTDDDTNVRTSPPTWFHQNLGWESHPAARRAASPDAAAQLLHAETSSRCRLSLGRRTYSTTAPAAHQHHLSRCSHSSSITSKNYFKLKLEGSFTFMNGCNYSHKVFTVLLLPIINNSFKSETSEMLL